MTEVNPIGPGGGDQQQPEGSGIPGWVWFVLIYGVGNVVLYMTTGILLLPIPRK